MPESVTAKNHPVIGFCLPDLAFDFTEHIFTANKAKTNNPRPHISRNNQLNLIIC
jgi:hypothetical protein